MALPFIGSTSDLTSHQLRSPDLVRLTRNVYVERPDEDTGLDLRTRCKALQLIYPAAVFCLWTAAELLKLPLDGVRLLHLARGKADPRTIRDGAKVHRYGVPESQVMLVDGIRVTDGPRTLADLAAYLEFEPLLIVGDRVAARWSKEELEAAVTANGKRRGAVFLGTVVPLLDGSSDSPQESINRHRLHVAGYTRLRHKVIVRDAAGQWLCELDLGDEVAKVGFQYEGKIHFDKGVTQWRHDVNRDELARQEDWQVVAATALDTQDFPLLELKAERAYHRAAKLWGSHVLPDHLRAKYGL